MDKIQIDQPCPENWNNMQACGDGKFCSVCSKTVIDFTSKSGDEIIAELKNKNGDHVCGRFKNIQLKPAFYSRNRVRRWMLTVFTFIFSAGFLSSCWRHTMGCTAYGPPTSKKDIRQQKKTEAKANKDHTQHFQK
jgi:sarcosine oxidase delta subunit